MVEEMNRNGGKFMDNMNFVRADDPEDIRTRTSSRCRGAFRLDMSPWSVKHELFQIGRLAQHVIDKYRWSDAADLVAWMTGCLQGTYGSAEEVLGALSNVAITTLLLKE